MSFSLEQDYKQIFERYYRPVCCFFVNRGIPTDKSRDLTQETMLRVYQGLRSYGTDGNFDGWLFQIAANVWRNELRRRGLAAGGAAPGHHRGGRGSGPIASSAEESTNPPTKRG